MTSIVIMARYLIFVKFPSYIPNLAVSCHLFWIISLFTLIREICSFFVLPEITPVNVRFVQILESGCKTCAL